MTLKVINETHDAFLEDLKILELEASSFRLQLVMSTLQNAELLQLESGKKLRTARDEKLLDSPCLYRASMSKEDLQRLPEKILRDLNQELELYAAQCHEASSQQLYLPKFRSMLDGNHLHELTILNNLVNKLREVLQDARRNSAPLNDAGSLLPLRKQNSRFGFVNAYHTALNTWAPVRDQNLSGRFWNESEDPRVTVFRDQICVSYQKADGKTKVSCYDTNGARWFDLPDLPNSRAKHSLLTYSVNKLFVIGGRNMDGEEVDNVDMYDSNTSKWTKISPLITARESAGSVALSRSILVVGGGNRNQALTACEFYDFRIRSWGAAGKLNNGRIDPLLAYCQYNCFVFGGYDSRNAPISTIERYDSDSRQWTLINACSTVGRLTAATTVASRIYLVGSGLKKHNEQHSVECFFPGLECTLGNCVMSLPSTSEVITNGMVYIPYLNLCEMPQDDSQSSSDDENDTTHDKTLLRKLKTI